MHSGWACVSSSLRADWGVWSRLPWLLPGFLQTSVFGLPIGGLQTRSWVVEAPFSFLQYGASSRAQIVIRETVGRKFCYGLLGTGAGDTVCPYTSRDNRELQEVTLLQEVTGCWMGSPVLTQQWKKSFENFAQPGLPKFRRSRWMKVPIPYWSCWAGLVESNSNNNRQEIWKIVVSKLVLVWRGNNIAFSIFSIHLSLFF